MTGKNELPADRWLTINEAAAHLGVGYSTIKMWHQQKFTTKFPSVGDGTRIVRVRQSALDRWFPEFLERKAR